MRQIRLGRKIYTEKSPLIVAEMGAGYYPLRTLKRMIRAAAKIGLNGVKFQTYQAETIALEGQRFSYADGSTVDQYKFFKDYQLAYPVHFQLKAEAEKNKLIFFSSACDFPSLDFLVNKLKVKLIKIASQDCTNYPFLERCGQTGLPIILSTGIASMPEVRRAVKTIEATGNRKIVVVHCPVDYPCQEENLNLAVINQYKSEFPYPIGFSDHSKNLLAPTMAAALGIVYYERHFILPRQKGPDSAVASDSKTFKTVIEVIGRTITALGGGEKKIFKFEKKWQLARKKIVVIKPKHKGDKLARADLDIRRAPKGLAPDKLNWVIGKTLAKSILKPRGLLLGDIR